MTATADQVIAACAAELGYYRKPGSRTKYGEWYGIPTGQWCAMFLSYKFHEVGGDDIFPKHAYTPTGVGWFKQRGQWHTGLAGVRRGDIVYFDFPGAPNRVSHVGIVESVRPDGYLATIEGNTSGPTGDQRNGGALMRKVRRASIVGYGRPAYGAPAPAVDTRPKNADGSLRIDQDGIRGAQTIARWQEVMGFPQSDIDGKISSGFSLTIQRDQRFLNSMVDPAHIANLDPNQRRRRRSLAEDGDEGKHTVAVRQFWLHNALGAGHIKNLIGKSNLDFDGELGPNTNVCHQFALNLATRGSRRYP